MSVTHSSSSKHSWSAPLPVSTSGGALRTTIRAPACLTVARLESTRAHFCASLEVGGTIDHIPDRIEGRRCTLADQ
jgi:hypothetical protein